MSKVEYLARLTCDCGASTEVAAWAETYIDGGVMAHEKPATGQNGDGSTQEQYVPWKCHECAKGKAQP